MQRGFALAVATALSLAGLSAGVARADREVDVQPGDNLAGISIRYYGDPTRVFEISGYNHLGSSSPLQPGERLMLPDLPPAGTAQRAATDGGALLAMLLSGTGGSEATATARPSASPSPVPSNRSTFALPVLNTPGSPNAALPGATTATSAGQPALVTPGIAIQSGIATWYGPGFVGQVTYCGDVYDDSALTAASNTLPCGAIVVVTDQDNGRSVRVRIDDRGAFQFPIIVDLSRAAFAQLAPNDQGIARVSVSVPAQ